MSLQFIMGPSGSGKSHYLYQWVTTESLKNPDKNYIVLVPEQFTTMYESVMAKGCARIVETEAERREALRMIVEKYSPEHREKGMAAIERSISRTAVIAIDVNCLTGKQKLR